MQIKRFYGNTQTASFCVLKRLTVDYRAVFLMAVPSQVSWQVSLSFLKQKASTTSVRFHCVNLTTPEIAKSYEK